MSGTPHWSSLDYPWVGELHVSDELATSRHTTVGKVMVYDPQHNWAGSFIAQHFAHRYPTHRLEIVCFISHRPCLPMQYAEFLLLADDASRTSSNWTNFVGHMSKHRKLAVLSSGQENGGDVFLCLEPVYGDETRVRCSVGFWQPDLGAEVERMVEEARRKSRGAPNPLYGFGSSGSLSSPPQTQEMAVARLPSMDRKPDLQPYQPDPKHYQPDSKPYQPESKLFSKKEQLENEMKQYEIATNMHPGVMSRWAQQHNWILGGLAELVDNSVDAGAENISIDVVYESGKMCLTVTDDGCGMDFFGMKRLLTVGHDLDGSEERVGMYGVGAKEGTLRLGEDAFIISKKDDIISMGLMSTAYNKNRSSLKFPFCARYSNGDMCEPVAFNQANYDNILANLPFGQKNDWWIGQLILNKLSGESGTHFMITNLRTDGNEYELDLESHSDDIQVRGKYRQPREGQTSLDVPPDYSLRKYLEILYLNPKAQIRIKGQDVAFRSVEDTLTQKSRKHISQAHMASVVFGMVEADRALGNSGLMVYYGNRLMLAYRRVDIMITQQDRTRGMIGLVTTKSPDIRPLANKQGFVDSLSSYKNMIAWLNFKAKDYYFQVLNREEFKTDAIKYDIVTKDSLKKRSTNEKVLVLDEGTWVQCDIPQCNKWRYVEGKKPEDFPGEFFCYMLGKDKQGKEFNCDVPEDKSYLDKSIRTIAAFDGCRQICTYDTLEQFHKLHKHTKIMYVPECRKESTDRCLPMKKKSDETPFDPEDFHTCYLDRQYCLYRAMKIFHALGQSTIPEVWEIDLANIAPTDLRLVDLSTNRQHQKHNIKDQGLEKRNLKSKRVFLAGPVPTEAISTKYFVSADDEWGRRILSVAPAGSQKGREMSDKEINAQWGTLMAFKEKMRGERVVLEKEDLWDGLEKAAKRFRPQERKQTTETQSTSLESTKRKAKSSSETEEGEIDDPLSMKIPKKKRV